MTLVRALFVSLVLAGPASAQDGVPPRIGIAAPLSGPEEILGRQLVAGSRAALDPKRAQLQEFDDGCSAEGGARVATQMRDAGVRIAVGFLCTSALEAAMPILRDATIPVIDVGVRADRLLKRRESDSWPLWRIAPGSDDEAEALARFVRERWRTESVGLVEDGSATGRDLADRIRERLEADGYRFALIDNFRPAEEKQFALARRIAQSGVTHVVILGSRSDVAVIVRDAAAIGLDLSVVGGEALLDETRTEPMLPNGIVAVSAAHDAAWPPSEEAPVDEGYGWPARLGVEIAQSALASGRPLADTLASGTFETSAGTARFGTDGAADILPFRAYRWEGDRFLPEDEG
ncbi:ABC transporter substrate-binding protein [Aureimonas jatrophae]|uniref:Amino acid/amide ABC transporter substrate-binding protein, HAAT family n=1 Tax=Aureimonas jatrophae TaxID=1166073 RepID=A0A1H0JJK6_9HYPH|nr:ABC transporter substrate-binding protein [Aureimonas jatrophae]MBB3951372.1 branched-chain amino acid transport system substrate-binding protein [Aureimonas jatrophae]SDO43896.1 amino acid/amide ABC transporter substrate-binding protein, HAAT family [Aureimonas jatrophae]